MIHRVIMPLLDLIKEVLYYGVLYHSDGVHPSTLALAAHILESRFSFAKERLHRFSYFSHVAMVLDFGDRAFKARSLKSHRPDLFAENQLVLYNAMEPDGNQPVRRLRIFPQLFQQEKLAGEV